MGLQRVAGISTAAESELLSSRFLVALAKCAQEVGTYKQAGSHALESRRQSRPVDRAVLGAGACIRGSRFVRIVLGFNNLGLVEGM